MSNAVYPSDLVGLAWSTYKAPTFSTIVQKSTSGREVRVANYSYPTYDFSLSYEVLREVAAVNELRKLMGFYMSMLGSFDSFLYNDPSDNACVNEGFGVGAGVQTKFQLTRALGGFVEPLMNINVLTNIKLNGSVVSGGSYSVDSLGMVTFTAPPNGTLTWNGNFYFRCRFLTDTQEYEQFYNKLWTNKKVEFRGCTGNKI